MSDSSARSSADDCLPDNDGLCSVLKQKPDMNHCSNIFTDRTLHNNTKLFPVAWTNPDILANSAAYNVVKRSHMPPPLERVIKSTATNYKHVHAYASCNDKAVLITSSESAALYTCGPQMDNVTDDYMLDFDLPISQDSTTPLALLLPADNDCTHTLPGVLIVNDGGKVRYWSSDMITSRRLNDFHSYQIQLTPLDKVTCISHISTSQAAIGTSTGDVFILNAKDQFGRVELTAKSLYKRSGLSSLFGTYLPAIYGFSFLSNSESPDRKDSVLKIVSQRDGDSNRTTILSAYHLSKWSLADATSAELISKVAIVPVIRDCLAVRVLPKETGQNVDINVLDIDRHGSHSWALLVSYSVAQMGRYSQFAIVIINDIGVSDDRIQRPLDGTCDSFESYYKISECISLPYSAVLRDMTRQPTVTMATSGPIAFVTFADTVIATSVDRRSLFEESVILKEPDKNAILCIAVGQRKSTGSACDPSTLAYIFTAQSGILIFKIDNQKILAKRSEGNIYASTEEDLPERDTDIAKSRLEQAVFFGQSEESESHAKAKVEAARLLFDEIVQGSSPPKISTMDTHTLLEKRLLMTTRLLSVLKANGLMEELDDEYRYDVIMHLEHCYIATELWRLYSEKRSNDVGMSGLFNNMWMTAVQRIYPKKASADVVMRHFLSANVSKIPEFLEHLKDQVSTSGEHAHQDRQYQRALYELNTTVLHIVKAAQTFENEHLKEYPLKKDLRPWSVQRAKILGEIFELASSTELESAAHLTCSDAEPAQNRAFVNGCSTATSKLQKQLHDIGDLLLNLLSKTSNSLNHRPEATDDVYKDTRKWIIEVLCKVGCQNDALDLAEKHGDFTALIDAAQYEGSTKAKKHIEHYLDIFGKEFAFQLFQWCIDNDREADLLQLHASYNDVLSEFLKGKHVKVSWRHYLRIGDYKSTLVELNKLLPVENKLAEKRVLLSNAKLLYLTSLTEGSRAITVSQAIASPQLSFVTTSLELVEAQEQLLADFNKALDLSSTVPEKWIDKANIVVECKAVQLKDSGRQQQLQHFKSCVVALLKGKALSCQEFISVLILMDKDSRNSKHFLLAFHFANTLMRGDDAERHAILNKIWKQVYLKDNWKEMWHCKQKLTDAQLYVRLRHTTLYYLLEDCKKHGVRDEEIMRPSDLELGSGSNEDKVLKTTLQEHDLEAFYHEILCILQGTRKFPEKPVLTE